MLHAYCVVIPAGDTTPTRVRVSFDCEFDYAAPDALRAAVLSVVGAETPISRHCETEEFTCFYLRSTNERSRDWGKDA